MKSNPDRSLEILIVEDNRTQAEYLRHLLEKRGHLVRVAQNGFEALDKIGESKPDIILTDVMMPDMDGYTLCKKIKKDKKTSEIPVILVTHLYSPVDVIKGLEAGADNFIIKPYDPEYIFSRIAGIIQAQEHPPTEEIAPPLDVVFSSEVHTIASSRMQILNILLSTYETAVKNNSELQVAHERLHYTNAQLQKLVEDLEQTNESLHIKNLERGRLETSLIAATEKITSTSDAIRAVLESQVQPACSILSAGDEEPVSQNQVEKVRQIVNDCQVTLSHTGQFLLSGSSPRGWHQVRNLISTAVDEVRLEHIRYENLIPEDIEISADNGIGAIITALVAGLQSGDQDPEEIRFSFHVRENGYSLFFENNGAGIPDLIKEQIFSIKEGLSVSPNLYLIREMLQINGIGIQEMGREGVGIRFVMSCPENTIRFASDIGNPEY